MNRGKSANSFSFIKRFRRRQTAVRGAACLLLLLVLNFFFYAEVREFLENVVMSVRVYCSTTTGKIGNMVDRVRSIIDENTADEIRALKAQNEQLKWQLKKLKSLRVKNAELQNLLSLKEKYEDRMITAKVITIFVNDFVNACIINVGQNEKVYSNDIVINADGLVGRVIEVHKNWSKVLLITDENSNIPAKIGEESVNAIVTGGGYKKLLLSLLHEDIPLKDGDVVQTSEYGGIFDPQLPVGKVVKRGDDCFVKPYVNFKSLHYVSVVRHAS